jgi:hypothetical protein
VLNRWKKQVLENLPNLSEGDNQSERPHQALDYRTPALAYTTSPAVLYSTLRKESTLQ